MKAVACLLLLCSPALADRPTSDLTEAITLDKLKAWEANQAKLPLSRRPYDLKGDRLGMSLKGFEVKYRRWVP